MRRTRLIQKHNLCQYVSLIHAIVRTEMKQQDYREQVLKFVHCVYISQLADKWGTIVKLIIADTAL